jgi:hypothetical protein
MGPTRTYASGLCPSIVIQIDEGTLRLIHMCLSDYINTRQPAGPSVSAKRWSGSLHKID